MAQHLNWSTQEKLRFVQQLEKEIHDAVVPIDETNKDSLGA
jgi:hypothetical protein